jgi:hypothetical protein
MTEQKFVPNDADLAIINAVAVTAVLTAANIDTDGLVIPDPSEIDAIEDDTDAALVCDRAFRALHVATGRAWVVMGEYAAKIHDRKLWAKLMSEQGVTYGSFKDWCTNATNKGRTTVYGEMTLVRELGISRQDLMRVSKANAFTLLKVKRRAGSSKVTAELIEYAATMDDLTFQKHCQALLPGAAGDEIEHQIKFKVPASVATVWKETVEMFQVLLQTNEWEIIIERMALAARDTPFANETGKLTSLEGMSNFEAYTRIQETLAATGNKFKRAGKQMANVAVTTGPVTPDEADDFTANTDALVESDQIVIENEELGVVTLGESTMDAKLAALDEDFAGDDDEEWDAEMDSTEEEQNQSGS